MAESITNVGVSIEKVSIFEKSLVKTCAKIQKNETAAPNMVKVTFHLTVRTLQPN